MKLRFPLYGRILTWFFLNLVLLAALFYGVFKAQLRLGLDSLLVDLADERVQTVSDLISAELGDQPRAQWTAILQRFSAAYHVQFYLFRNDGMQVAGASVQLPAEVIERLTTPPPLHRARPGAAPMIGPPLPPAMGPMLDEPPGPPGATRAARPRRMIRSHHPEQFWILVRIRVPDNGPPWPAPLTLLARSDSLLSGGLVVDLRPWLGAGAAVILCSALFWFPLVRGITHAVSQVTRATEEIAEGRFDAKVDVHRSDELGRLGHAINRMAGRLAGFVTGQKRFLGDVAHELCSPLARMEVALAILEQRADENQRRHLADAREEVENMSRLVSELLSFSHAGLQGREIQLEPVKLAVLARQVVAREAGGRPEVRVVIDEGIEVLAAPELLARAIGNLVRNALRYAGGALVSAESGEDRVWLRVSDDGPGVPDSDLERIFDPFFRLEASRSREGGGVGLGLAIVRTCVEACQGTVRARNRQPHGLEVELEWKTGPARVK